MSKQVQTEVVSKQETAIAVINKTAELFAGENLKNLTLHSLPAIQAGAHNVLFLRDGTPLPIQFVENKQDENFLKIVQANEIEMAKRGREFVRPDIKVIDLFSEDAALLQSIARVAEIISTAGVGFPGHLKGNFALCQFVATAAYKYGLDPFALAANNCYQVNGRNEFFGSYYEALLTKFAPIVGGILHYHYEGNFNELITNDATRPVNKSPNHAITVYALADNGSILKLRISMAMVDKTNSPLWRSNPAMQLKYFATRIFIKMFFTGLYNNLDNERTSIDVPTISSYSEEDLMSEIQTELYNTEEHSAPFNRYQNHQQSAHHNVTNVEVIDEEDKEVARLSKQINDCQTLEELQQVQQVLSSKKETLSGESVKNLGKVFKAKKERLEVEINAVDAEYVE